jgi:hypothetical protein
MDLAPDTVALLVGALTGWLLTKAEGPTHVIWLLFISIFLLALLLGFEWTELFDAADGSFFDLPGIWNGFSAVQKQFPEAVVVWGLFTGLIFWVAMQSEKDAVEDEEQQKT